MIMPTGFTKDTWVTSVQIKPEHPQVTHHICVAYIPHDPKTTYGVPRWQDKERDDEGAAIPEKGPTFGGSGRRPAPENATASVTPERAPSQSGGAEDCYLPGNVAADYRPLRAAKLIPAGYDISYSIHYTPNGTEYTDHIQMGFTMADVPPSRRYVSLAASAPMDSKRFAIPPNDPNWESPPAVATFLQDVEMVFMMPHMHYRGKDAKWTLEYPDGRKEVVLDVPRYDFNWQLGYDKSIMIPAGTKLRVEVHYDNSVNNKFNPNPNKTVYYGQMLHYFLRGLYVLGVPMMLNFQVIYFRVLVTTDRCGFNTEHTKSIIAARQKLTISGNLFCATLRGFVLTPAIPSSAVALDPKCTVKT